MDTLELLDLDLEKGLAGCSHGHTVSWGASFEQETLEYQLRPGFRPPLPTMRRTVMGTGEAYSALGLPPGSGLDDIKAAYRQKALQW